MTFQRVNSETVNDRAKLLMHRLVARRISERPELIEVVKHEFVNGPTALDCSREWMAILDRDPKEIRKLITSRSSRMNRLRVSSPFATVAGLQDPAIRKRIWKVAKKGHALSGRATIRSE